MSSSERQVAEPNNRARSIWDLPFYPFLIAIWPPLALAAKNPAVVDGAQDLAVPLLTGLIVAVGVGGVCSLIRLPRHSSAVIAAVSAIWFWWFRDLVNGIATAPALIMLGIGKVPETTALVMLLGGAYLLLRHPMVRSGRITRFANGGSAALVCFSTVQLLFAPTASIEQSASRPPSHHSAVRDTLPNVYILVLDGYAGRESMNRLNNLDLDPFISGLEARGFFVPTHATANYLWTFLGLAAMLNWEEIGAQGPDDAAAPGLSEELLHGKIFDNKTFQTLLSLGYRLAFAGANTPFTRSHAWADLDLTPRQARRSEYASYWPLLTPLPRLRVRICRRIQCAPNTPWVGAEAYERLFQDIIQVSDHPGPWLTFAHILLPHEPFLYDESCRPLDVPIWRHLHHVNADSGLRAAYAKQVYCLNTQLIPLLDSLLARSRQPPIIVLQADHGPRFGLMLTNRSTDATGPQLSEWFDIFAAYYAPEGTLVRLTDSITPIDAFRTLFGPPNQWDTLSLGRSYYSRQDRPFMLEEVVPRRH